MNNAVSELPLEFTAPAFKRPKASRYLEYRYGITVAPATLAKLACRGGGPPFYKSVRTPMYPRDQLDAWAVERLGPLRRSTSDEGGGE